MKWIKKGILYIPDKKSKWRYYYGSLPTPILIKKENKIRIYFGTSGKERYCGISFIDVQADNPSKILYKHDRYSLNKGEMGHFDDAGINPSSIVISRNKMYLYYVGYQRCQNAPYMLFPGLAVSNNGAIFKRYSNAPIIDRSKNYYISHAAPYVIFEQDKFKMWLWIGKKWANVNSKLYISASIGYAESKDGLKWDIKSTECLKPDGVEEFSLGRPWVLHENNLYKMWYSIRLKDKLYRLGYAESKDGITWKRKDDQVGIDVSERGWDSKMICYPAVIKVKDKTYMFYNGNNNGETGFGYAVLET
ncbi:MAG: hypothetical protein M1365_13215 [Actinobacteria bacterium]|nr:hypothetical protein [Actinomycetota bacterium]